MPPGRHSIEAIKAVVLSWEGSRMTNLEVGLATLCRAPCRTVSSHVCSPNRGAFESLRPTSNTNNAKPINIWSCLGHGLWPNFAQAKFIRISKTKLSGRVEVELGRCDLRSYLKSCSMTSRAHR